MYLRMYICMHACIGATRLEDSNKLPVPADSKATVHNEFEVHIDR